MVAHGSALGNMGCIPPGVVVFEIFPHGFFVDMFQILASDLDITLIPVLGDMTNVTQYSYAARDVRKFNPDFDHLRYQLMIGRASWVRASNGGWEKLQSTLKSCRKFEK